MSPIIRPDATRHLNAPRSWDPARDGDCGVLPIADLIDEQRHAVMESWWKPEPEELAALAAGGAVILGIFGRDHPVVYLGVTSQPVASGKDRDGAA